MNSMFSPEGIVDSLFEANPFFYDRAGIFWEWNKTSFRWEMSDEINILNKLVSFGGVSILDSKLRGALINGLKQKGRRCIPQSIPKTTIQFQNKILDINKHRLFYDNDWKSWRIEDVHTSEVSELNDYGFKEKSDFEKNICASPEFFVTNPLPHELNLADGDENNDTPIIDKLFTDWVGEKNKAKLYQILAYCMLPDYPIERIFCLIGSGANGKSCFLQLLRKFLGDYNVTATSLDILLKDRFEASRLHKKLACIMGETNFNELSNTQLLKSLVSGKDLIGMQYKFKDSFEVVNYAKIIIATNSLPPTTDKTIAFYRRWIIIEFPKQFDGKQDVISRISDRELSILARKCFIILADLLRAREFDSEGGFKDKELVYESKSNPLEQLWKEEIQEDYEGSIPKWKFRDFLESYLKERGFRKRTDNEIASFMRNKNIEDSRVLEIQEDGTQTRHRHWMGIIFRNKNEKIPEKIMKIGKTYPISDDTQNQPVQTNHPIIPKDYKGNRVEGGGLFGQSGLEANLPNKILAIFSQYKGTISKENLEKELKLENIAWSEQIAVTITSWLNQGLIFEPKKDLFVLIQ